MNTQKHPKVAGRLPRVRLLLGVLLTSFVSAPFALAQTATITVNAGSVVRDIPAGIGGVCMSSEYWESLSPNYRNELIRAQVGVVRIVGYPADTTDPTKLGTVEALDRKVAQIINSGAAPAFIQCIESESQTVFKNALLRLDGTLYPAGDTTPIRQRVATNLAFLVNRYRSAPFNLTTQYWEISNEPDLANVNYRVANPAEYIGFFDAAHDQLVASGVRNHVLLAGPSMSWDYGYDTWRDTLMHDFLTACANQVDIVTRHQYAGIRSWEGIPYTPYALLNNTKQTLHFDHTVLGYSNRGEARLLAAMAARGVPASVGTGMTEMDLWWNENGTDWFNTVTQSLWHVLSHRNALYNSRSLLTNSFLFDRYNGDHAFFNVDRTPGYSYWAAYIIGALTGDQVLAQTSNNSHLVVAGSRDDRHIYVLVLNRHDTTTFSANVAISNASVTGTPVEFTLSASENTLAAGVPAAGLGTTFTRAIAPMSIKIFRYQRADAPTLPAPPAPPSTTHFTTGFDSVPTGMQTYAPAGFTPVVASSRLQLTSTVANMRAAVVFNGQPLPAARTRAQIRFGFHVVHPNAEGFVFGAYSASPGAVGNAGQALGYQGQNNRLWGVKIDNNPDQIAIIPAVATANVDGWATQAIQPYSGSDKFMVVDYDGAARTLRARMYQGTNDSGTLLSDVTSRVGVPASLPSGTVFGFTGATSGYTQTTYINDLTVLADNGSGGTFVVGQEVIVDNAPVNQTGTWVTSNMSPGYYGTNYSHDNATPANKGSCTTTYVPTLTGTGPRDVYVRYIAGSDRASNAPYAVNHAGGSITVPRDQRTLGGQWVLIGRWTFNHGTGGSVVLGNGGTTGFVIADAVRFVNVAP
jgi:hypothetical protein